MIVNKIKISMKTQNLSGRKTKFILGNISAKASKIIRRGKMIIRRRSLRKDLFLK
jgi:hypothetical protein